MLPICLSTGISRRPRLFARTVLAAGFVLALLTGIGCARAQSAVGTARVPVKAYSALASSAAMDAGPLATSERLTLTLTLAPSDARAAALQEFLIDVTTPGTADYHHWMTPSEFGARFGADAKQISSVMDWAEGAGLSVSSVSPALERMTVSGFTLQMERAFAVSLHLYHLGGVAFYAPASEPTLESCIAQLLGSVDGLDNNPSDSSVATAGVTKGIAGLANLVDRNDSSILEVVSGVCGTDATSSMVAQYSSLFDQAAAQGLTVLISSTCASGGFPGNLANVTSVASLDAHAETGTPIVARPDWQVAPGLPQDGLRHSPDLSASSVDALVSTLTSIASSMPQRRLGNINPVLYKLSPEPGLFTHADQQPAGTWEAAIGLGLIDLESLAKHYPRGTGSSFTSFTSSNYSPVHGQSITFSATVTSGTGGAIPTGTVSFVTTTGATLGTANLIGGTATYTSNTLSGGTYVVTGTYSGDGTYASSSSPVGTVLVQPEASQLAAAVSTGNTIGGTFSVLVTATAASGVGTPSGTVSVVVSGTSQTGTGVLVASGINTSSVTITLAAKTVGGQTLSINCSGDQNFSCYNPLTKRVSIGKATPTLNFSYAPSPAVSGANITLTASLTTVGKAPAPSGNVEFFDGATVLNAGTLTNGATTSFGTVPMSATHSILATYDGDANYNPVTASGNTSSPIATTTTLVSSNAAPAYGQTATFTATVASVNGTAAGAGVVTFIDSISGLFGKAPLSNGTATFSNSSLPGGFSNVTASYRGDSTHSASLSGAVPEVVLPETDQITVQVPSTATFGFNIPVTILVTSASTTGPSPPTGSVTLTPTGAGYTGSYSAALSSVGGNTGSATLDVPGSGAGTVAFSVTYNGDRNFAAAGPITLSATIAKVNASTSLTLNPIEPMTGQPTILTAQVATAGSVGPAGTVTFLNGGVVVGSSSLNSNGVATIMTSFTGGNHVIAAQYHGDNNYTISTSPSVNTSSGTVATTAALASSASTVASGKNFVLTANLSPHTLVSGSQPSGTVQILDGGVVLATAGLSNGSALITTSLISVRTHSLVAYYSGDVNYAASSSPAVPVGVSVVSTATSLCASSYVITTGQSVTFSATIQPVTTVNGASPSGTVVFSAATQGIIGAGQVMNGVGTFTSASLPAGVYILTATYSGDGDYASSASTPGTALTVASSSTVGTLAATISPATASAGTTANITATVTVPGTTAPTGTVLATIVLTGSTSTNVGILAATGANTSTAAIPVTVPAAGDYSVIVSCPSNAAYTCNSVVLSLTSTASTKIPTSTVLTLSPASSVTGTVTTLTATVSSATSGYTAPSGTVSFFIGNTLLGSGTIASNVATLTYTFQSNTGQSLTAVYSGDTVYAASTSPEVSTVALPVPTTTTLSSTASLGIAGETVTLIAQVAGNVVAGKSPSGSVSFYISGTLPRLLGMGTLSATGSGASAASLYTTQIPAGTQTIYAVYSGDATFATSVSALIGIGLTDYSVSFTPASLSLTAGQTGSVVVLVTPSSGFSGVISMGCTPPANMLITCSISPQSLTNGGTAVLTINTVASQYKAETHKESWHGGKALRGIALASLLGLMLPRSRRGRIPSMLLVLLLITLGVSVGCSKQNLIVGSGASTGSPLGTASLTINTSGSNGVTTVTHDHTYQVTIQ